MLKNYIALHLIDIIALLFLIKLLYNDNFMSQHRKKAFLYGIIFTILVILAEGGTMIVGDKSANFRELHIFLNMLGFALTPVISLVIIVIFDANIIKKHKLFLLPSILNFLAVLLSPSFGLIFYVDVNNFYQRGNIFLLFIIVYIINIILLLITTLYTGQKYFYPIKWEIASLSFFTVAGTFIQILIPSIYSSWHCATFSLFLFYLLLSEFEGSFDTMTKLYNRAAFDKAVTKLKSKKKFSVIVMDINKFKEINDTFGHEYGDTILKEVATIVRDSFDSSCSCYRIGGDEFCTICRHTDKDKLDYQLESITNSLAKERQKDRCLPMVSYGYSIFEGDKTLDFKKIFKEADEQMYMYKKNEK